MIIGGGGGDGGSTASAYTLSNLYSYYRSSTNFWFLFSLALICFLAFMIVVLSRLIKD